MLSTTKSTLWQLRLVPTSTLSLKPDLQTNNAQVLKTVNPNVRFHIPDTTQLIPGVAVHLKGLIDDCDAIGIPHPSERDIRKELRSSKRCITHGKQRFLQADFPASNNVAAVQRSDYSSWSACVLVPKYDIPPPFFEIVENGKYYYNRHIEFVHSFVSCITICRHRRGTHTKEQEEQEAQTQKKERW